jgi:uncharacterized protein (DUF1330 family)
MANYCARALQIGKECAMISAYLVADVDVTDAAAYEEYKRKVPATAERYGGTYLARGGLTKVLEGDWEPHSLVIIELQDMVSLMGWYGSPDYSPLKARRLRCAKTRILALEGMASLLP